MNARIPEPLVDLAGTLAVLALIMTVVVAVCWLEATVAPGPAACS